MKATELRLGNYVKDGIDIIQLDKDSMICAMVGRCEFDPIPLTEEWLVKFGHKLDDRLKWYYIAEYEIDYMIRREGSNFIFFIDGVNENIFSIRIEYVHQLQNLYFALKEELETT